MLTAPPTPTASASNSTFESLDPATGQLVGRFPVDGPAEVAAVVERARAAAAWWGALEFGERARRLRALKAIIARRAEELGALVHRENGKPRTDAFLEIMLAIDHLEWAARNAPRVLGRRRVRAGLLAANQAASVEYLPLGVIGVIGPWNYPVYTPMGSISYALAAGNAVVFKPSEYTPAIGRWLADAATEAIPEYPVLQVITGAGETGAALCASGVDKLAFTGSARTGRRVMAACAETLTPVLLELGGNDAMIVDEDADLDQAANAAVWGALQNAGQACISVERVYVVTAVHDSFVSRVVELAGKVRTGTDIGPITMPGQLDIISRHLGDAFDRGARAVVGGPGAVHAPFVDPVVLVDVPRDALILREETFGPTLPIVRVRDADEAVRLANDTRYGLGSVVFAKRRGLELARRLRAGMTSVNAVIAYAAVPSLPFGGVGDSGFGRIHGDDGLREFSRAKATTMVRFPLPVDLLSFQRPEMAVRAVKAITRLRHGRGGRR
ncbi:MAG TPA: aldehyde dehydrogenase family protein [Candidatus Dormibacteraeota bacterium]|jgi:acyl-CoA reductase-like NAD-dependent aldehyde dehydrogenase|nr:aldehyde dehydrogenase family protein [Candidatus Dormibacteraeota bacterium]